VFALTVLTFINLFNYLDRMMLSAILEPVKRDLGFSDSKLGLIGVAFVIVYTITSPIFGSLGDRKKRPPLIALGVTVMLCAGLFTALGQAKLLVMKVAPSRQQVPLQKIGDKAEKFKNLCRKR